MVYTYYDAISKLFTDVYLWLKHSLNGRALPDLVQAAVFKTMEFI